MIESHLPRIQEYDQRELTAQEGQYQCICHCTNHIASDVHSGSEQLCPCERRIRSVDFLK